MLKKSLTAAALAAAGLALGASTAHATVVSRDLPTDEPFKSVSISDEALRGMIRFTFTPDDPLTGSDPAPFMGQSHIFFDTDADGRSDILVAFLTQFTPGDPLHTMAYGLQGLTDGSTTDCQVSYMGSLDLATGPVDDVRYAAMGKGVIQIDVPAAVLGPTFDVMATNQFPGYCSIDDEHIGIPATFADAIHFKVLAPETADDVPADEVDAPVPVTLTATGSAVDHTYYETGANPAVPTTASTVYDPTRKPVLADGESISYFSVSIAGAAEAPKTSAAVHVKAPAPAPTPPPAESVTPPTAPAPQLRFDVQGAAKQLLTNRHDINALAGCGPVSCILTLNATFTVPGERSPRTLTGRKKTLAAGAYQRVTIPTTLALRRAIRAALKHRPNATVRLKVTATATAPSGTATITKTVDMRRLIR